MKIHKSAVFSQQFYVELGISGQWVEVLLGLGLKGLSPEVVESWLRKLSEKALNVDFRAL